MSDPPTSTPASLKLHYALSTLSGFQTIVGFVIEGNGTHTIHAIQLEDFSGSISFQVMGGQYDLILMNFIDQYLLFSTFSRTDSFDSIHRVHDMFLFTMTCIHLFTYSSIYLFILFIY